jgi:hypothetical protein
MSDLALLEPLLLLVQSGAPGYRNLAAELLDHLLEASKPKDETFLILLLRCLLNSAMDPQSTREIRNLEGLTLLLGLIK